MSESPFEFRRNRTYSGGVIGAPQQDRVPRPQSRQEAVEHPVRPRTTAPGERGPAADVRASGAPGTARAGT
jgi:hypothetical protein